MDFRARSKGDEQIRLDRVAARCRRERADYGVDEYWVAFRRRQDTSYPRRRGDRVILDLERRNGAMLVGGREVLVVDGRAAVVAPATVPGYRRVWAMIEEGFPAWTTDPVRVERSLIGSRSTETLYWEHPEGALAISYDVLTGLSVATRTPDDVIELTDLRVDSEVSDEWFEVPARLDEWRGGRAFVMHDMDGQELYSASWQPHSGPGGIHVDGPRSVPLDVALAWARSRGKSVRLGDAEGRQQDV